MTARFVGCLVLMLLAAPLCAQETQFGADLRREREQVAESCDELDPKALGSCVYTLATGSPFHVAFGGLAPQNGFGFGLAFNEHYTPNESWRLTWTADGVATPSGSWRGGASMKFIHTPATAGVVVRQPGAAPSSGTIAPREFAVADLFAQAISLKSISYYGSDPQRLDAERTVFGERQTIVGGSVVYPLSHLRAIGGLRPALVGGLNGRFVDVRPASSEDVPSIEQRYDERTAAGLNEQRAFVEFHEGIRFKPSIANGWLRFDYLVSAQQFRTSSETRSSFNRWTLDLQHEIPLYRGVSSTGPRAFNGPNECGESPGSSGCPSVQWSRNRQGSIGVRLLLSESTTSGDNRVPFYFQPTLGGSDINGEQLLASYDDYRFRGPHRLALQERIEHAVWGPIGAFLLAEQGKVTPDRGDLNFEDLVTSTTVGLTLRAGGFPLVNLSYSWGGEGHHIMGTMSTTLLGGSPRPSLY